MSHWADTVRQNMRHEWTRDIERVRVEMADASEDDRAAERKRLDQYWTGRISRVQLPGCWGAW